MKSVTIAVAALLTATPALTATKGVEEPSAAPTLNVIVVQGCFSSGGELVYQSTELFNSKSKCGNDICLALGKPVAGTMGGNQCFCGDKYPPKSALVDDSECNVGCTGYDQQACGGVNYWTIYNTGKSLAVPYSGDEAQSGSSASTSVKPTAVVTVSGGVVTVTGSSSASSSSSSGSSNTAGIAAGVVVGIVAVASIVGGIFFFIRRRRNKEIEEEHRRNAAINTFVNGSKPPGSSGGYSVTDARLDPVMAQRRISNGSIADNQDYSRRILRVTNA